MHDDVWGEIPNQNAVLHRSELPIEGVGPVTILTVDAPPYEPSAVMRQEIGGAMSGSRMADTLACWDGNVLEIGATSQNAHNSDDDNLKWVAWHHRTSVAQASRLVTKFTELKAQGLQEPQLSLAMFEQVNEEDGAEECLDCQEPAETHYMGQTECRGRFLSLTHIDDMD